MNPFLDLATAERRQMVRSIRPAPQKQRPRALDRIPAEIAQGDKLFRVSYVWSGSNGIRYTSHTVASGSDRQDAEFRFFRQHPHVQPGGDE